MKLLLIEDELSLRESIATYFRQADVLCEVAPDFNSALEKVVMYTYDCVIMDLGLPDGNGFDLLQALKQHDAEAGVIIISADSSLEAKIDGFNLGSDDYLTKPFHLSELNARVNAVIRRKQYRGKNLLTINEIEIDLDKHQVHIHQEAFKLTKLEFKLLLYLMTNSNRVVSKNSIAEHLWGDYMDYVDSYDFIYSHIKNLRKKLQERGCGQYLETVYGVGYKFNDS